MEDFFPKDMTLPQEENFITDIELQHQDPIPFTLAKKDIMQREFQEISKNRDFVPHIASHQGDPRTILYPLAEKGTLLRAFQELTAEYHSKFNNTTS